MDIMDIVNKAGLNARDKGFYDSYDQLKDTLGSIKNNDNEKAIDHLLDFVEKQNISTNLMLIVSELGEAIEHLRTGKRADGYEFYHQWKDTFEEELADVLIRLADLCFSCNIDISKYIKAKMLFNSERKKMHGKLF